MTPFPVFIAAPLVFAAIVAAAWLVRSSWPFEVLFNLFPQLAAFAVFSALLMLGIGRPFAAAAYAATAIACLIAVREMFDARPIVERADVTIVWHNTFESARAFNRAAKVAESIGATAFAVTEHPGDEAISEAFRRAFPYQFPALAPKGAGPVIYSRTPFLWTKEAPQARRPRIEAGISAPGGPLRLVAVHAPVTWTPRRSNTQKTVIRDAIATSGEGVRTVLVGDFNTTRWSASIAAPLRDTKRLRHVSLGVGATWLAPVAFVGVPIDHAFVSGDLDAEANVGPATGSDHLPVIVRLRTVAAPTQ